MNVKKVTFFEGSLNVSNTLVKYKPAPIKGWETYISHNFEIIGKFLRHYTIIPTWIDCRYTFGWFDEESGNWTGEIGKVRLTFL